MPTIGSLDGTFGHGRGPQVAPLPGFTFFPRIGNRSTWTFAANGAFSFSGNDTYSVNTSGSFTQQGGGAGNVYVIVPNTTFLANVKIWAAGGGSGGNASVDGAVNIQGGGAGAVAGQILFESGQEYSVVASGGAINNSSRFVNSRGGGGGGVSGIFKGNAFAGQQNLVSLIPFVLAGGGGGGDASTEDLNQWRFPGAGGGNLISQLGEQSQLNTGGGWQYSPNSIGQSIASGNQFGSSGQVFNGTAAYTGGMASGADGGGGGGFLGGPLESGGQGYVSSDQLLVSSITGFMSLPALYDDSSRGNAGDSAQPGKVIIYTDEYRLGNLTATGGTVTDVPIPGYELSYRTHTFTANGKFTITSCGPDSVIDIFAVGGGGGSAGKSGAGGGSVAIRTNFPVPVTANYIVTVGSGGSASDSYATTGVGRIFGGYRGGDSAFFNNSLNKYFPDSYTQLIYSYGKQIRYISGAGDGSNGLTPTTAYPTFAMALTANANNPDLIVFAVLSGTYETATPISDLDKPRVFVCSPGKVTINYTPDATSIVPMMSLGNPYSALYGATIIRTMPDSTDVVKMAFFQGGVQFTSTPRARGSYYNCVFRENGNNWTFVWDQFAHPFVQENARFKIENCTFFTKNNSLTATGSDATRVLLKNCIFNKAVITNAVQVNCAANVTVGSKYVTSFTDKGVYAGEYSWSSVITVPERNARLITMIARGGGGAPSISVAGSPVANGSPEYIGGTSPGNNNGDKITYIQPEHQANVIYSSYGYPGGKSSTSLSAGGGGAGGPGFDTLGANSIGGIGIEWPYNSNTYYGNGGSAANTIDISLITPGTVGKGGGGATPTAGNDGTVIVRYIIPGSYTPPNPPPLRNLVASGGLVTSTSTYVQHEFATSGGFIVIRPSNIPNFYIDMIIIGGGGGGSGNNHNDNSTAGRSGEVLYYRIPLSLDQQISRSIITVAVGVGGAAGDYHYEDAYGKPGTASTVTFGTTQYTADPGGLVYYNQGGNSQDPAVLITDGLFSDNTIRYGGSGGKFGNALAPVPYWGRYGSGGYGATPGGFHGAGSAGISGGVIIRYPILPI